MDPLIGSLCSRPEGGVDVDMYRALTTELSIDEAYDLFEIDQVARSYRYGEKCRMDEEMHQRRKDRERRRG